MSTLMVSVSYQIYIQNIGINNSVKCHSTENSSESTAGEFLVNRGYIRATPSSGGLPYTSSDTITIDIDGNVPTTQWNLVYTSWYFNNGYSSFPSGTSLNSLLKLPTGISQTLRITNPTPLYARSYEVLLNDWEQ